MKCKNEKILFQEEASFGKKMSEYWGGHQRFFRALFTSMKVDEAVKLGRFVGSMISLHLVELIWPHPTFVTRSALANKKAVVYGLQSTGEATINALTPDANALQINEVRSFAATTFNNLVMKLLRTGEYMQMSDSHPWFSKRKDSCAFCISETPSPYLDGVKAELMQACKLLKLPFVPLDTLIAKFGADAVAEMTGRTKRIKVEAGTPKINLEKVDHDEQQRLFMEGKKLIAVISDAASVGISLHSSRLAINNRKRSHITIELPWSAEKTVQQFGRTHRSNQANSPEYTMLVSNVAGEMRFVSAVARRMKSLGAITQGDRSSTMEGISSMALNDHYASKALAELLDAVTLKQDKPVVLPKVQPVNKFFAEVSFAFVGVDFLTVHSGRSGVTIRAKKDATYRTFLNR
jgi:strawberry notch-like protein